MFDYEKLLRQAIRHFWTTRKSQSDSQGSKTGHKDQGSRSAVTGGKHLDGFITLCRDVLIDAELKEASVFCSKRRELPGYFRAEKSWDLLAVAKDQLVAVIEFKAHIGPSFGNNLNNRAEEALGNAADLKAAYREGAFKPSAKPWMGFVMIVEECERSTRPVKPKEPHFAVFPEFKKASYVQRYEILLTKLLREQLYDGACLLLTTEAGGLKGECHSPSPELSFQTFVAGLEGRARAFANKR
jgi:hypothetical protein